jgi:hypothetical protein
LDNRADRSEHARMSVNAQVHSKFKLFSGPLGPNASLGALATEVEQFAAKAKAAAKSIGVEYVEHSKQVIVSLGYRDDEAAYPIKLHAVSIGKIDGLDAAHLAEVEKKMEAAAAKITKIICHELLVTEASELIMVFMTYAA